MLLNSKPVRFLITRLARSYGFLDPVALLARMRGFAKPSEVAEPIELLRAGMLFHARGLVNTKAIQNNLDWVWPYWVERQFNPSDPSFIPRAFSFSHINLTHRNWTAVGLPDVPFYPIIDPRGLVTPIFDGWSLDFWYVPEKGDVLFPSKLADFEQKLWLDDNLRVRSVARAGEVALTSEVSMCLVNGEPHCCINLSLTGAHGGHVAVALRPYNPEGVSSIEKIGVLPEQPGWLINDRHVVTFDRTPLKNLLSTYAAGDVSLRLAEPLTDTQVKCDVSMATAVALFPADDVKDRPLEIRAPIYDELDLKRRPKFSATASWSEAMQPLARLQVPDASVQKLFDLAVANVVLHTPKEVYPGPYTYKRFWFRDAVFVLNSLLSLGGVERTRRAMGEFVPRQRRDGYFLSQEGEWDSNGEALWFFHRFVTLTGEAPTDEWLKAIVKGARWISRKRIPLDSDRPEAGLLPAGFSAEHLGPNDYYYWDDFWAVAGLRCAANLLQSTDPQSAAACEREANEFLTTIQRSYPSGTHRRFPGAIPASPHRRMDSGAVGSLVADYPLQLFPPGNSWITKTADYLTDHSLHEGGFFQNMIHSGINAYLTIHLAQVRLRAGDTTPAWALMDRVVALASPTGQWPEAIHPLTGGGCMGDGEHIWAAAEWLMLIRNLFVREEAGALIIGSGLKPEWTSQGPLVFGPTLTPHGPVTVIFESGPRHAKVQIKSKWRGPPPAREIRVPGHVPLSVSAGDTSDEFVLKFQP
jgi:hypothetical protein